MNFKIVSAGVDLSDFKDEKKLVSKLIKYSEPNKGKKTIFIVSHRKNPIKNCDTVIDLEKENKTKNIES